MLKLLAFGVKFQMESNWGERVLWLKWAKARQLNLVSEFQVQGLISGNWLGARVRGQDGNCKTGSHIRQRVKNKEREFLRQDLEKVKARLSGVLYGCNWLWLRVPLHCRGCLFPISRDLMSRALFHCDCDFSLCLLGHSHSSFGSTATFGRLLITHYDHALFV